MQGAKARRTPGKRPLEAEINKVSLTVPTKKGLTIVRSFLSIKGLMKIGKSKRRNFDETS